MDSVHPSRVNQLKSLLMLPKPISRVLAKRLITDAKLLQAHCTGSDTTGCTRQCICRLQSRHCRLSVGSNTAQRLSRAALIAAQQNGDLALSCDATQGRQIAAAVALKTGLPCCSIPQNTEPYYRCLGDAAAAAASHCSTAAMPSGRWHKPPKAAARICSSAFLTTMIMLIIKILFQAQHTMCLF